MQIMLGPVPVTILTALLVFLLGINACLPLCSEGHCLDADQEKALRLVWSFLLSLFPLSSRELLLTSWLSWVLTVSSYSH